jgi:molybdopterin/thiamine biosynthesis adenylyltransferase
VQLAATSLVALQATRPRVEVDVLLQTYDDAAYERFCADLVEEGFSPVAETGQRIWTGPVRASLQLLTDAARMKIHFYEGWPLRYAHVIVDGLATEHASSGTICLWAEDDPAQIVGSDLAALWNRLDEWAERARRGFQVQDQALDAYLLFGERNSLHAELPLAELIRGKTNGYLTQLFATRKANALIIAKQSSSLGPPHDDKPRLRGAFYLRRHINVLPRNLNDVRSVLTRRQALDLDRSLAARGPAVLGEPSGGHDFIVLAWPRHGREHDAVVVAFQGAGDGLRASALSATSNDVAALQRRAGPDVDLLTNKTVLIAGAGSVGGHVAVALASSGVGTIHLSDSDHLKSVNLVRHVSDGYFVGYEKTIAVMAAVVDHAPWTTVKRYEDLPHNPLRLAQKIEGVDLVIDCTGFFSMSAALAETCRQNNVPLITGALFHRGALARVQRQTDGDTPIAARSADPIYFELPPEEPSEPDSALLELGCTARINIASPVSVLSTAAEITQTATDFLTGRCERSDERILVFLAMDPPFDCAGILDPLQPRRKEIK